MKIVEVNATDLNLLSASLRPEHYVGFLIGGALLALTQDQPDDETANHLGFVRREYVARQKRNGDPTGLPVAPVYWTDLTPEPNEDAATVIACEPPGGAFFLCSSVPPHGQWVVKHEIDDDTITVYKSQADAEHAIEARAVEYQERWNEALAEVKKLYRRGDVDGAEYAMEDFEFDITTHEEGVEITIEGERIKIGGGEEPAREVPPGLAVVGVEAGSTPTLSRGAAIESVKAYLRVGANQDARMMCEARGIPITIQESQGIAYVDGYPLEIPRIVPRPSPEPQVIIAIGVDGNGDPILPTRNA